MLVTSRADVTPDLSEGSPPIGHRELVRRFDAPSSGEGVDAGGREGVSALPLGGKK